MQNKVIPFSPPSFTEAEEKAVVGCITSSWTGTGPKTIEFENLFAKYKNANYSAGVSSCTSALFLSLKALGIGEGDEVITTAMTFCSTVNVILHCGAKPILCDIDNYSKNIDVNKIEELINARTKAIIPVHYAGFPCDMDELMKLASNYELNVIEDCAHAIEAKYNSQHCGTFGDIGCFSFYATKNIAIGEGGMAISNHESLISKIKLLGLHGLSRDAWRRFESVTKRAYDVIDFGYKMNITDLQSSIGMVQLQRLEEMRQRRKEIWKFYLENLSDTHLELPNLPENNKSRHALHLFSCGLPKNINRDEFVWKASNEYGVTFGIHYKSIPSYSAYTSIFPKEEFRNKLPNAFDWGRRTISLSLSAAVSDNDCEKVVLACKSLLK